MKYNKEDYVARITTANPVGLVIITYELILDYIDSAAAAEGSDAIGWINKAKEGLLQLMSALDFKYEISQELFDLYLHVNKQLTAACYGNKTLDEAASILRSLMESFIDIEKNQADLSPVMENAQPIYAGLTYKNGELSEFVDDEGRGYKA